MGFLAERQAIPKYLLFWKIIIFKSNTRVLWATYSFLLFRYQCKNGNKYGIISSSRICTAIKHQAKYSMQMKNGNLYDMHTYKIRAVKGKSAKIPINAKHSARITAFLSVRPDGMWIYCPCMLFAYSFFLFGPSIGYNLAIFFILKAQPHGSIDKQKLRSYPKGNQKVNALRFLLWMDRVLKCAYILCFMIFV